MEAEVVGGGLEKPSAQRGPHRVETPPPPPISSMRGGGGGSPRRPPPQKSHSERMDGWGGRFRSRARLRAAEGSPTPRGPARSPAAAAPERAARRPPPPTRRSEPAIPAPAAPTERCAPTSASGTDSPPIGSSTASVPLEASRGIPSFEGGGPEIRRRRGRPGTAPLPLLPPPVPPSPGGAPGGRRWGVRGGAAHPTPARSRWGKRRVLPRGGKRTAPPLRWRRKIRRRCTV